MVDLLTTIVGGRTIVPADRHARKGAWPGPGLASAPAAAAAVGEPRRATTRLTWLPLGTSPAHASPIAPSRWSVMRDSFQLDHDAQRAAAAHSSKPSSIADSGSRGVTRRSSGRRPWR